MKKLKFLLLTFLFISCLNSCFFLASFCADYGCMGKGTKFSNKEPGGIYTVFYKKGYENYLEEILQRKKEYVEIENHKILLPENMTLKKFQDSPEYDYRMGIYENLVHYYLYDKERKVGFPLGFRFDKNENSLSQAIDGTDHQYIGKVDKYIYYRKNPEGSEYSPYVSIRTYINRINEEVYITFADYSNIEERVSRVKITNFLKELVKEWEK